MAEARPVLQVDTNRKAFERVRTCADALRITLGDLRGPILTRLAQTHRIQIKQVFATEGKKGASGRWKALNPEYAVRKRKKWGRRTILVAGGDMRERFTTPSRKENIERYVSKGRDAGTFAFGAKSKVAVAHFEGFNGTRVSTRGKRFRMRLPKRDMVTKTRRQIADLLKELVAWYVNERIPQVSTLCSAEAIKSNNELNRLGI